MSYRRSKYHAKKAEYNGEVFDSLAEAAYARHLDGEVERGAILYYVRQPRFTLGCPENVYKPDFHVVAPRWTTATDVKGHETPKFRKDRRLWARYGPCPLQVIRLNLRYPKADPSIDPAPLPAIKGIDFDVIHGGQDRRSYGPLHPEFLRRVEP